MPSDLPNRLMPGLITVALLTGGCADRATEAIRELDSDDLQTRRAAARSLAETERSETAAVPALIESLRDADPQVRRVSAYALGVRSADAGEAVPALRELLDDSDAGVRLAAAYALVSIAPDDPSPAVVLAPAARSGDARAVIALGQMKSPGDEAVAALVQALKLPSSLVRRKAIESLKSLRPELKQVEPALRSRLRDSDPAVSEAAADALRAIESSM